MYNCGMIATRDQKGRDIDEVFRIFAGVATELSVDIAAGKLTFSAYGKDGKKAEKTYAFRLGEFENALVMAGGWVAYAAANY